MVVARSNEDRLGKRTMRLPRLSGLRIGYPDHIPCHLERPSTDPAGHTPPRGIFCCPQKSQADATGSMSPLRGANILRLAGSCGAQISFCGTTSLRTCADVLGFAFGMTKEVAGPRSKRREVADYCRIGTTPE